MKTIFRRTRPGVKAARSSTRATRPFGEGLLDPEPAPTRPARHAAEDEAWWAANAPGRDRGSWVVLPGPGPIRGGSPDAEWDRLAAEAAARDAIERGLAGFLIPAATAEWIAARTLVGHEG